MMLQQQLNLRWFFQRRDSIGGATPADTASIEPSSIAPAQMVDDVSGLANEELGLSR
jgi:hypothetical protein